MASLIGQHSAYHSIPIEARFHCEGVGLPSVIAGKTPVEEFRDRLVGHYFQREARPGSPRGLHLADVERTDVERAADRFVANFTPDDPGPAAGELMASIFDPVARKHNAGTWVEMTPPNIEQAPLLQSMFPASKLVHIIRDGRDVAVSVASKTWGPNDPFEAIRWWGRRLRAAERQPTDPEYVLVVGFEALMDTDREAQLARVCEFLGISVEDPMRRFFEEKMTPERARIGRWRRNVPEAEHDRFDETYREVVDKLRADGIPSVEALTLQ